MWEIYAYQNADSLFGVFNAAAAIHASSDYASAVAAVAFCGFVAALIAYAFAPEKLQGWKWLASVVLVFGVLIVPRVTVGIVDRTGGSAVRVVDNVPFGVAVLGSLTSTIGHTLTGLFETAFQVIPGMGALPAELSYERNGLMFGNRLVRETGNVVFQDPAFRTDLVNFIHNCTTYDLIDGTLDPATFSSSDDVWPLMASPNPARFSTLTGAGGAVGVDTCPNVYLSLNGRLPAQIQRIEGRLAFQLNPTLPGTAAAAAIAGQIQRQHADRALRGLQAPRHLQGEAPPVAGLARQATQQHPGRRLRFTHARPPRYQRSSARSRARSRPAPVGSQRGRLKAALAQKSSQPRWRRSTRCWRWLTLGLKMPSREKSWRGFFLTQIQEPISRVSGRKTRSGRSGIWQDSRYR